MVMGSYEKNNILMIPGSVPGSIKQCEALMEEEGKGGGDAGGTSKCKHTHTRHIMDVFFYNLHFIYNL